MATVYFPSLPDAEAIEVELLALSGQSRRLKLLVDSGFTGQSSVVLGQEAIDIVRAAMPRAQVSGAIRGEQNRAWVTCRVSELGFQQTTIAILTDLSSLSLPHDVEGMVGLSFLRYFVRWGAERTPDGWKFYLSNGLGDNSP